MNTTTNTTSNTRTNTTTTTGDLRPQSATEIVAAALAWLDGQHVVTQSRCVDLLLDLHQATDDPTVRGLIGQRLTRIRHCGAVSADRVHADLAMIAAILTCDGDWFDRLLEHCCAAA